MYLFKTPETKADLINIITSLRFLGVKFCQQIE